jgi:hypothetical protein
MQPEKKGAGCIMSLNVICEQFHGLAFVICAATVRVDPNPLRCCCFMFHCSCSSSAHEQPGNILLPFQVFLFLSCSSSAHEQFGITPSQDGIAQASAASSFTSRVMSYRTFLGMPTKTRSRRSMGQSSILQQNGIPCECSEDLLRKHRTSKL